MRLLEVLACKPCAGPLSAAAVNAGSVCQVVLLFQCGEKAVLREGWEALLRPRARGGVGTGTGGAEEQQQS